METVRHTLKERATCVVIPTYNNGPGVVDVVERVKDCCADVIVVCDGSTDGSELLLRETEGITLIAYPENRGKGYALKRGLDYARRSGFAYAITLDADGQHFPSDIPKMVKASQANPGCIVVGCRTIDPKAERSRGSRFANAFANFWFTVQTFRQLRDTQSGFRLYPLRRLWFLPLLTRRYEAELLMLVLAAWHGTRIVSTPVDVYYPPAAQRVSHFRPLYDFGRISVLNTLLCFMAVVYGWPLMAFRFLMRLLREVYCGAVVMVFAVVILPPLLWLIALRGGDIKCRQARTRRLAYRLSRFVVSPWGIPGVRFTRDAACTESLREPKVILCNHQSALDLPVLMALSPDILFLTNGRVWRNRFYGRLVRGAGYINTENGIEAMLPALKAAHEAGLNIAVFPEGTRSADCRIGRFHKGAFHIARALNADMLPLCIYGTGRVFPKHGWLRGKGCVHLAARDSLSIETQSRSASTKETAHELRRLYTEWYERLSNLLSKQE